MPAQRVVAGFVSALLMALLADGAVRAQWHASVLALRTNGAMLRPGDCVRLDLLSLEDVFGPMTTRVTYRFTEAVSVKADDGRESRITRPVTRELPAGPSLDGLAALQRLALDETLCFGVGTVSGVYQVEVVLRPSASGAPYGTLSTCVVFIDPGAATPAATEQAPAGCPLLIRGVRRADPGGIVFFDGDFPASGLYKAAVVRNDRVEAVLDRGVYRTGPHELVVTFPTQPQIAGGDVDLVILDGATGASTTLSRVAVPRPD